MNAELKNLLKMHGLILVLVVSIIGLAYTIYKPIFENKVAQYEIECDLHCEMERTHVRLDPSDQPNTKYICECLPP